MSLQFEMRVWLDLMGVVEQRGLLVPPERLALLLVLLAWLFTWLVGGEIGFSHLHCSVRGRNMKAEQNPKKLLSAEHPQVKGGRAAEVIGDGVGQLALILQQGNVGGECEFIR